MMWQNIVMAFASLGQAKLRSFLTMLGIIIGVSSVVTVLAVGDGVKQEVSNQVSSFGANLIQVNPGQALSGGEEGSNSFNFASAFGASTLTEQDVIAVKNTPGVEAAAPFMLISGVPSAGDNRAPAALLAATTPPMIGILNREVVNGSFITDATANQNVIVLGHGVAQALFGNENPIGKAVAIRDTNFSVVGVMEEEQESGLNLGFSFEDMVFMPFEIGKKLNGGVANIMEIDVQADDASNIDTVVNSIKSALKESHGGEEDFTVLTSEDALEIFDNILNLTTSFVAAIAAISLLVGGVGVMNIMLVSVTERTREIGVRKAIGASNRHILSQFIVEAIVLSLFGGLLGVGFSLLQGVAIKAAANITPVFSIATFVLAVVISVGVGVIFGLAPAIKAARKNPIDALRFE